MGRCRAREKGVRCEFEGCLIETLSQEAQRYEHDARIEDAILNPREKFWRCIARFRKSFRADRLGLFQKRKEK